MLRGFVPRGHAPSGKLFSSSGTPPTDAVLSTIELVEDMKEQYDNILAIAQTISGAIFDLSRAMEEMTTEMVDIFEKTADGETVQVFKMTAKVQYEISKLFDVYASQVSQTFIRPIENLLRELDFIEDINSEYEDKRKLYDEMRAERKNKGIEGDALKEQSSVIKDQLSEHAKQLDNCVKSLNHGQKHNLVSQAIQHYTAQCHFFNKGLNCLHAAASFVKDLSQKLKIDDMFEDDLKMASECVSTTSCQIKMREIKADSYTPVCPPLAVDSEKLSSQDFLQKENIKYAFPNPNGASFRGHNQSKLSFATNKVAAPGIAKCHSSSRTTSGLSMHLSSIQQKDASSSYVSSCSHSEPLPLKYIHSDPFSASNICKKGNILGYNPEHKNVCAPWGLAAPRISPFSSILPVAPAVGNELHKLPTPPQKTESVAQCTAPLRERHMKLKHDRESTMKQLSPLSTLEEAPINWCLEGPPSRILC